MTGVLVALACAFVGLVVWLARQNGQQAARLEALKKEAEGYAKSQQILERVCRMSNDVVRRRLQERTK